MPIEALLLDLGGVFLIPDGSLVAESLADAGVAIGPGDFEQAHYAGITAVDERLGDGEGTLRYLGGYLGALGVQAELRPQAMKALATLWAMPSVTLWRQAIPDSIAGLRRLAEQGVPLGFVSNSDGTAEEQLRQHRIGQVGPGEGVEVEVIIDSAVVGLAKPDPRVFEPAVARPRNLPQADRIRGRQCPLRRVGVRSRRDAAEFTSTPTRSVRAITNTCTSRRWWTRDIL